MMRVLIGCEFSGVGRQAFRDLGHDAWSCDMLPAEDGSPHHLQADVLTVLDRGWDLAIFHPPCTRLTNAGVRWLHERNLWDDMREAARFFLALLHAPIPRVAVENPVPHRHAREIIGRPSQALQPWQFGDQESKTTCLWLRGLPPLMDTDNVRELMLRRPKRETHRVHYASPGPDRWKERSRSYAGVMRAMAQQWGIA